MPVGFGLFPENCVENCSSLFPCCLIRSVAQQTTQTFVVDCLFPFTEEIHLVNILWRKGLNNNYWFRLSKFSTQMENVLNQNLISIGFCQQDQRYFMYCIRWNRLHISLDYRVRLSLSFFMPREGSYLRYLVHIYRCMYRDLSVSKTFKITYRLFILLCPLGELAVF